jgi:hypothetical protein
LTDVPDSSSKRPRRVAAVGLLIACIAATTAVAASVTTPPTISGEASTGSELTADAGSWTPSGATPTYTWLRCDAAGANCVGISGACGRRYVVRAADEAHTLRVRLTATEANGSSASGDSAPTAVVARKPYAIPPADEDTCVKVTPSGPGQGTFSSGTQTPAGSTPPPNSSSRRFIDPFPVVRISGRFKGRLTTLTRVTVRSPRGSRIRIRCQGRGCPYRRRAIAVRFIRVRSLQRTYRPRATVEIRVTQSRKIGKYTRIRTRRGKAPVRTDRCLNPGRTTPVRCPSE